MLSVAALAACGGSDSSPGSSSTGDSTETSPQNSGEGTGENGGKPSAKPAGQDTEEGGSGSAASVPTSPLRVSGGGSAQFQVKGGDNSIQEFGEESDEGELEEAATALHDFYVARVRSEWRRACANLAGMVVGQLEQLAAQAKSGDKGCAATLAALTPSLPPSVARESTIVDAGSLRVEGDRGFLIYRGAEGTVYAVNMALEDGSWKVGALAGVPLS